jgi:hypothetical protein
LNTGCILFDVVLKKELKNYIKYLVLLLKLNPNIIKYL